MTAPQKTQVIIVGGGITGLTLALALERWSIPYVLLEGYSSCTPNIGASIGLFANGLRILDQLGVYDELVSVAQPVHTSQFWDGENGRSFMKRQMASWFQRRHGYKQWFMDRYGLLCVLHRHIKHKERLLVNKKVVRVETFSDRAVVHTADGDVFVGQVVVGGDGVRSTVRKEMWRNADEQQPGAIPEADKNKIRCEHLCLFGTAKRDKSWDDDEMLKPGNVIGASRKGIVAGYMCKRDAIFVFWFKTLPKEMQDCDINDIPRFTHDDVQQQLETQARFAITEKGLHAKDIYDRIETSGVTALPHFVLKRWHFGRIVIVGDAAHKFNPLVGQGGNSCIESCAALVNSLRKFLGSKLVSQPVSSWPLEALDKAFIDLEQTRVGRVTDMVDKCQDAMRGSAWESWRLKFVNKYVAPLLSTDAFGEFYSSMITGAERLEGVDVPEKPHDCLFDDEKRPVSKTRKLDPGTTSYVAAASIAAVAAFFTARTLKNNPALLAQLAQKATWVNSA